MTGSLSPRVASAPTMLASAPSARWVCPRMTPGFSEKVRLTRSSNSRMRTIWVYIHVRRSFERSFCNTIPHLPSRPLAQFLTPTDVTKHFPHRNFGRFLGDNTQQHAFRRRIQFVAHLLRLQLHQRLAQLDEFPFALEPAHYIDFGGVHATGFGNSNSDGDGDRPRCVIRRPLALRSRPSRP